MELEIGNLESKVKTQVEQLDLQTESLSHAHSVATERQLRIETLVQELAMQRQTGETIIAQKKEYVAKVMAEMDVLRAGVEHRISLERMVQEDLRTCAR